MRGSHHVQCRFLNWGRSACCARIARPQVLSAWMLRPIEWRGCQRARTTGSWGARSSILNSTGFRASRSVPPESYFASKRRSLVERTKCACSYASTSESLYLTVRRSRTKGMYEPATRALRSVFTLSWCREASCFSVRKTSSRTSAAEERLGVERFNLSVISKNLPRPGIDGILNRAGFSILELRPVAGARTMVAGKRGASLNSVGLFDSRATTTWEGAHDVAGKRGASLNSGEFLAVGIVVPCEPRASQQGEPIRLRASGRLRNERLRRIV